MWRRYLLGLVGAVVGAAVAALIGLRTRGILGLGLLAGTGAIALGERLKLAPTSEEANKMTTLFSEERKK